MSTIIGVDKSGNVVQFQTDGQSIEVDAQQTAFQALITAAGFTAIDTSGNLTVTDNATVGGTLGVTGAATLSSTLAAGATTITGAATVSTTLGVTGAATVGSLKVDTGTKTAAATSGAATLNKESGTITSESLTTAKGAFYTLTLTNSLAVATDIVLASVALASATTGTPLLVSVTPASTSIVFVVQNIDGTNAFNGTIAVSYVIHKL